MRIAAALAGALLAASASAQEVLAPPAGSEFVMRCGGTESTWVVKKNAGGIVRVERANDASIYREGPAWGYLLGDIYDELGRGKTGGVNRMILQRGPAEGIRVLKPGTKTRFTYHWTAPNSETDRSHVISVSGPATVKTEAFGEQEVYDVTDDISSPMHDLRRSVRYSPKLRMFVAFTIRDNRGKFEQSCVLASLKAP